jgi:hypothetical protein
MKLKSSFLASAVITVLISAVFVCFYQVCLERDVPISYEGDAFSVLTTIRGYAEGIPILWRRVICRD